MTQRCSSSVKDAFVHVQPNGVVEGTEYSEMMKADGQPAKDHILAP